MQLLRHRHEVPQLTKFHDLNRIGSRAPPGYGKHQRPGPTAHLGRWQGDGIATREPGPPVGMHPHQVYTDTRHPIPPRSPLVFYTDGMIEDPDAVLDLGQASNSSATPSTTRAHPWTRSVTPSWQPTRPAPQTTQHSSSRDWAPLTPAAAVQPRSFSGRAAPGRGAPAGRSASSPAWCGAVVAGAG
ncbi:SpoIIE family protein phosphatase [Kitasatospora sp. NPDC052896]|uniref:SpoIIE family protein phosphatase n=1 Tax=Kitasatospora sp. NPDC052896 TaxID=3364061 RepID=UPI0037CA03E0